MIKNRAVNSSKGTSSVVRNTGAKCRVLAAVASLVNGQVVYRGMGGGIIGDPTRIDIICSRMPVSRES